MRSAAMLIAFTSPSVHTHVLIAMHRSVSKIHMHMCRRAMSPRCLIQVHALYTDCGARLGMVPCPGDDLAARR